MIRLMVDRDIDKVVEKLGFKTNWMPMVNKAWVDIGDDLYGFIYWSRHNFKLYILDKDRCDYKALFEKMLELNDQVTYFIAVPEERLTEQLVLRDLGCYCYKLSEGKLRFSYESNK